MRGAVLALVLAGCGGGGLRTPEVDDFDRIRSAEWIEWDRDQQGGDEVHHEFVMSSHGGLCNDLQSMVPEMADAYGDYLQKLEKQSAAADQCKALEDFYEDAAEITAPMFKRPLTTLSLTLRDPDDDRDDAPPEGDYDHGVDPGDLWFIGSITVLDANPYLELADAVGDCAPGYEADLVEALADNTDWFRIDGGDLDLVERGDEAYKLDLDGDLEYDDGDDAGEVLARGMFKHCLVEWQGWFEPFSWSGGI